MFIVNSSAECSPFGGHDLSSVSETAAVVFSSWVLYRGLVLKGVRVAGLWYASQVFWGSRSGVWDTRWDVGLPVFLAARVSRWGLGSSAHLRYASRRRAMMFIVNSPAGCSPFGGHDLSPGRKWTRNTEISE